MQRISKKLKTTFTSSKWMRPLSLMGRVGKSSVFGPKMELYRMSTS